MLRKASVLPIDKVIALAPQLKSNAKALTLFKNLLLNTPVDSYEVATETFLTTNQPLLKETLMYALAHAPVPDPRVRDAISAIVNNQKADPSDGLVKAGLLAVPHFLPPSETVETLQPLLAKASPNVRRVNNALNSAGKTEGLEPLFVAAVDGIDVMEFADTSARLDILVKFPSALIKSFAPIVNRILNKPEIKPGASLETEIFNAKQRCKPGAEAPSGICLPDFEGFQTPCDGPKSRPSSRVTTLTQFAADHLEHLLPQLEELTKSPLPQARHFVILAVQKSALTKPQALKMLTPFGEDNSIWLQTKALQVSVDNNAATDADLKRVYSEIVQANCLTASPAGYEFRRPFKPLIESMKQLSGGGRSCRSGSCA